MGNAARGGMQIDRKYVAINMLINILINMLINILPILGLRLKAMFFLSRNKISDLSIYLFCPSFLMCSVIPYITMHRPIY